QVFYSRERRENAERKGLDLSLDPAALSAVRNRSLRTLLVARDSLCSHSGGHRANAAVHQSAAKLQDLRPAGRHALQGLHEREAERAAPRFLVDLDDPHHLRWSCRRGAAKPTPAADP